MTPVNAEPVNFLLVDDLEENLLALEALLRRDGLRLLKAKSGPEALELLLKHEVALALIDVRMPGMDGFELAELMRGTERTRRVPIIFVTAGTEDQQRRFRGYETGAVDFLHKPIEPDVLKSKALVFFDLWRERQEVARQRDELKTATAEIARLLVESRRANEALCEADQRKDEFLATLAHELRNPLAPLRSGLEVMRLASGDPNIVAKSQEIMERQLAHMVRLVDDLLDISRVTSGKIHLHFERIEVRAAIDAAVETAHSAVEAGNHQLTIHLPDEPLWLHADAVRIAQVLGNLITNAAKYTPDGGRIEISAGQESDRVVIRIRDTGIGIPADMLPKVFDLFIQIGQSLDRAQGGLGIGLALVKKLIQLHGGEVTAESPGPGQGSTFTVRLLSADVRSSPTETQTGPQEPSSASRRRRVLIVDDNRDGAECLSVLLSIEGFTTKTAHSGPDALTSAQEFGPEVVLLDIGLPGLNGYEVAKRLRSDPRTQNAVLIAITGWGSDNDRRRATEAGFDHHLTKPVDPPTMYRLLSQL